MKGKVVVVTGASEGIGALTAGEIVKRGGKVALLARRANVLAEVARKIGGETLCITADVTRRADVERAAKEAIDRFGAVDVWISNAGRGISRLAADLTDDDIDQMMAVNFKSVLYGAQAMLPHFRARKGGHLIHVSSLLGRTPFFATIRSAYAASKGALNTLTTCLRIDLAPDNIRVSNVQVGTVATEFGLHALHGGPDNRHIPGAQPPDEVARVIADLIEQPRAEVYTRAEYHDRIGRYFAAEDVAELEKQLLQRR
jgi:NAD(P)-dependent dehydrogenase (short-subunit alcohol dehydrogenase family)